MIRVSVTFNADAAPGLSEGMKCYSEKTKKGSAWPQDTEGIFLGIASGGTINRRYMGTRTHSYRL